MGGPLEELWDCLLERGPGLECFTCPTAGKRGAGGGPISQTEQIPHSHTWSDTEEEREVEECLHLAGWGGQWLEVPFTGEQDGLGRREGY